MGVIGDALREALPKKKEAEKKQEEVKVFKPIVPQDLPPPPSPRDKAAEAIDEAHMPTEQQATLEDVIVGTYELVAELKKDVAANYAEIIRLSKEVAEQSEALNILLSYFRQR